MTGQEVLELILADNREEVKYKKDIRAISTLKELLESSAALYGENVAYYQKYKKNEPFTRITYKTFLEDVNALGTALLDLGLSGERIAVMGENSYMWCVSYMAVVCGVGVVVPIDKELGTEEIGTLLNRAEVKTAICTKKNLKSLKDIQGKSENSLSRIIQIDAKKDSKDELSEDAELLQWNALIERGRKLVAEGDDRFIKAEIDREAMSVLLFTSGTTGIPKGVMHSHATLCYDIMVAPTLLKVKNEDIFFSVLPLHHTYENTCTFLMAIFRGASVAFCQGLKYVLKDMEEIKPTMLLAVPAILENIHKKIWQQARKKKKDKALRAAIKINDVTKKLGVDMGGKLFRDVRAIFGGNMRMMICGGAAINPEVLKDFRSFGIDSVQGYGLTECAPLAALNPDTAPKDDAIGKEFPAISLKIDSPNDEGIGEICVKGGNVMLGYYEMPEETEKVIVDGWYHTGDVGYKDEEGYYYITGRMKNVIITKNGKNVYPEEVEYQINLSPIVAESMVFQEDKHDSSDSVIAATVVLDKETIDELYGNNLEYEDIEKMLWAWIDDLNHKAPPYRKIRHVIIREEALKKNTSNKVIRFSEENKRK